jgi:hypothetical protein
MWTKFNNNFVKINKQLSFTLANIIDNLVIIDTTRVAMSDNTILDFNHIKHAMLDITRYFVVSNMIYLLLFTCLKWLVWSDYSDIL